MLIKVCGISSSAHLAEIESLNIEMTGAIRYELSPRYSVEIPVKNKLPQVGVYVNESLEKIQEEIDRHGFDYLQLHGNESTQFIERLAFPKVIKAVSIASPSDIETARKYVHLAKYILLDTKSALHGGSGKKFDWDILSQCDFPFILSGGIGPDDAEHIIDLNNENPHLIGIDLNSRFEIKPGLKDINKLNNFIKQVRNETR